MVTNYSKHHKRMIITFHQLHNYYIKENKLTKIIYNDVGKNDEKLIKNVDKKKIISKN